MKAQIPTVVAATENSSTSNAIASTPRLEQILPEVTPETAEIVIASRSGRHFNEMSTAELTERASLILADLKVMTGLKLPVGPSFARLIEFLAESLKKEYPLFTLPLISIALKKHCHVLTSGENKSYGRDICLADIHQVLDAYIEEWQQANQEVDTILTKKATAQLVTEEAKENRIRATIEATFQSGDYSNCTYVDFNQLVKDNFFSESVANEEGLGITRQLKEKYKAMQKAVLTEPDEPQSLKGVLDKQNLKEKIAIMTEIENEIKASVVRKFMEWYKKHNKKHLYQEVK